ncbi:MAG: AmmeMemoRadiSam system protein A [Betaproteobacteria bacterium]|nr:AmmeMemoRadiSam system protein A [Betaproteobacteria bacterium]
MTGDALGRTLLTIARNAIARRFGQTPPPAATGPELSAPGATFVTLTQNGRLRGCIGSLEAHRPLATDVAENAVAAAFCDPRFAPLSAGELPLTRVEVSLLTPAEPFEFTGEADALARLRPGIDGLILTHEARRATFLPQVWETLPDPQRFMAQLKLKAGLPATFWDDQITLARYGVQKWKES